MSQQHDYILAQIENVSATIVSHSALRQDFGTKFNPSTAENTENVDPRGLSMADHLEGEAQAVRRLSKQASPMRTAKGISSRTSRGHTLQSSSHPISTGLSPELELTNDAANLIQQLPSNNVDFAAALGDRMITELRNLRADLVEKEEQLRCMVNKTEDGNATNQELERKLRNAITSEEKLKATIWELETHEQELNETVDGLLSSRLRFEADISKLKSTVSEKADELEALQFAHQSMKKALLDLETVRGHELVENKSIQEDLRNEIESYETQLEIARRELDLERERHNCFQDDTRLSASLPSDDDDSEGHESLPNSVPASPIKSTPLKNSTLESETMKGTLYNHQNKLLRQRKELEREKKLRLRLQHDLMEANKTLENFENRISPKQNRWPPKSHVGISNRRTKAGHRSEPRTAIAATGDTNSEWEPIIDTIDSDNEELGNDITKCRKDEGLRVSMHQTSIFREPYEACSMDTDPASDVESPCTPGLGVKYSPESYKDSQRLSIRSDKACKPLQDELDSLDVQDLNDSSFDHVTGHSTSRKSIHSSVDNENSRNNLPKRASDCLSSFSGKSRGSCLYRSVATQTEDRLDLTPDPAAFISKPTQANHISPDLTEFSVQQKAEPSSSGGAIISADAVESKKVSCFSADGAAKSPETVQGTRSSDDLQTINTNRLQKLLSDEIELAASQLAIVELTKEKETLTKEKETLTKEKETHIAESTRSFRCSSHKCGISGSQAKTLSVIEQAPSPFDEVKAPCLLEPGGSNFEPNPATSLVPDSKIAHSNRFEMVAPIAPSTASGTLRGRASDRQMSPFLSPGHKLQNQLRETPRRSPSKTPQVLGSMSSMSSFASEIEQCFNACDDTAENNYTQIVNNPSTIESITRTMIGMNMYKYTRRAGRQDLSNKRHKRYFWIHPYTKTLYWSIYNPVNAPEGAVIKSAPVLAIHTKDDFNPHPPGLHQQSIHIETPKRILKITALRSVEHEDWVRSLRFLVSNGQERSTSFRSREHNAHRLSESNFELSQNVQHRAVSNSRGQSGTHGHIESPPKKFTNNSKIGLTVRSKLSLDDVANGMGMEDIRACCNGQHNVASLSNRSTRSRSSSRVRMS